MTRPQADEEEEGDPQNGSSVDLIEYLLIAMVVLLAAAAVPPTITTFFWELPTGHDCLVAAITYNSW